MNNKGTFITIITFIVAILLGTTACTPNYASKVPEEIKDTARTYDCNYHTLSLKTHISFVKDDSEYDITGNLFTFITDPLTLYKDDEKIGYAGDDYHVVSQDDHAIYIDGVVKLVIEGNFEVFGNSYDLYDKDGNEVGYAEFNEWCTKGAIYNSNDEVVAIYKKSLILNDYNVTIYDNDIGSDEVLLLVVASYVSDYHADND